MNDAINDEMEERSKDKLSVQSKISINPKNEKKHEIMKETTCSKKIMETS
jgi:hypothetical protein